MSFRLDRLLALRRRAEEEAEQRVARTTADRALAEQEQHRLAETFQAVQQRLAAFHQREVPADGAAAQAAELFRARLSDEVKSARQCALTHEVGPLARARAAEETARQAHLEARREREALEKIWERQQARQRRAADRRAEDAASDLALAAHRQKTSAKERT
jgi:flagellar biosynthesis chaperone FliJ